METSTFALKVNPKIKKFLQFCTKLISKISPKIAWKIAQKGEKLYWVSWLNQYDNDNEWLQTVLDYFGIKDNQDFGNKTLLDIGSGPTCGILPKLKAKKRIAVDPLDIIIKKEGVERIKAPGEKIPLPDRYADVVFIYNVLQHVLSPEDVLKEGERILKKGGTYYILEQLNLPQTVCHTFSLEKGLFKSFIEKNNFEIIKEQEETDCWFDIPKNVPGSGYSVLCLMLRKK